MHTKSNLKLIPQKSLSWKLSSDINEQKTLFSEISLPYEVDFYGCACGHVEHIIHNNTYAVAYICQECGNEEFLDATTFLGNSVWYQPVENLFEEEYLEGLVSSVKLDFNVRKIYAKFFIPIPFKGDMCNNRLEYKEQIIFEVSTDDDGEVKENFFVRFLTDPKKEYARNLLIHTYKKRVLSSLKTYSLGIANQSYIKDLKEFAFFLKYPYLKDYQFISWCNPDFLPSGADLTIESALEYTLNNRREKSLKKALYRNYIKTINKREQYNFLYAHAVAKNIKDVNIAVKMLSFEIPSFSNIDFWPTEIVSFMAFLYSRYSYKQIANLFKEYEKLDLFWLQDTLEIYSITKEKMKYLEECKCKANALHDAFIRVHQMKYLEINFSYTAAALRACEIREDYEVKLPMNGLELFKWSQKLQNCLASYDRRISSQKSLVYGFFINGKLKFALEIADGNLIQVRGKYNRDLTNAEKYIVAAWKKHYF